MAGNMNLNGQRFTRLLVRQEVEPEIRSYYGKEHKTRRVLCRCDCGSEKIITIQCLKSGATKSCGCIGKERPSHHKHGDATNGTITPEYNAWRNMRRRCEDVKSGRYYCYGARGISVCERWRERFEHFLADMGRKPSPQHSIDRIDNDGNYEPGNCRWATAIQQANNKQSSRRRNRSHGDVHAAQEAL